MSDAKHTPGPWLYDLEDECIRGADAICVLGVAVNPYGLTRLVTEDDDMRLILAAPDLLAACVALMNADHHDHFAVRMSDSEFAAIKAIEAAIAKSTGATP